MLLALLQLAFLILPLILLSLAAYVGNRFGWGALIAPIMGVVLSYAAGVYLVMFGSEGSWQTRVTSWLRNGLLQRSRPLMLANAVLVAACLGLVFAIQLGPKLLLRGVVLLDNRPVEGAAQVSVAGVEERTLTGIRGVFELRIPDHGQTEITVLASFNELAGKARVPRGASIGFEVSLDPNKPPLTAFLEKAASAPSQPDRGAGVFGTQDVLVRTKGGPCPKGGAMFPKMNEITWISAFSCDQYNFEGVIGGNFGSLFAPLFLSSLLDLRADFDRDSRINLEEAIRFCHMELRKRIGGRMTPTIEGAGRRLAPFAFDAYKEARSDLQGKFVAVVVGINAYGQELGLRGSVVDAQLWVNFLNVTGQASQVTLLMDREASRQGIIAALRMAATEAHDGDVLMFVYSGHLVDTADSSGFVSKALVPMDFRRDDIGGSSLSLVEVGETLRRSKAGYKLVVLN